MQMTVGMSDRSLNERIEILLGRVNQIEALLTEHPLASSRGRLNSGFVSPVVSVIMPTWNRADFISDAIASVQAQSFSDWELIVVDDGSADDTRDVVSSFAADNRVHYVSQAHAGQSVARNRGLREARGELIAYQDSDNIWYPDFLTVAVTKFAAEPDVLCAYGALISEVHLSDRRILFEPFDRERLRHANFIAMTTLVHRRALYMRHGGFDETLGTLEDWELVLRYTQEAPAVPLPVLASRCRVVDAKRVSEKSHEDSYKRIRGRWTR
jgi:glycosyltransferase involved in cell wall biosynthesis